MDKKYLLSLVMVGVLAGCSPKVDDANEKASTNAQQGEKVSWRMASTFPSSLTILGTMGKRLESTVSDISGGDITFRFYEPSVLTPPFEIFDAVSYGAIESGWSTSGYWAGKVPALQLFSSVPFGPGAAEYLAWYDYGGGRPIFEEIYAKHNIHGIICGISPPEASGWFKKEINSIEDFKGLKIRFFGLGGKVLEKVGASPQLLAGGDIFPALERGTIDATEYASPAVDYAMGFYQAAKHYYFPGWHQQSTFFELMINLDKWNGLTKAQQMQIESACSVNIRYSLSEGEALQAEAIKNITAKGVQLHTWSPEVLAELEKAWLEVAEELSAGDPEFKRAWLSLQAFRESYKPWADRGYLKD